MREIRRAVILLVLSALPARLAAQAGNMAAIPALSDKALLLICLFGAAGAWLLRRPSRASGEKEEGDGTREDPRPPSMTETARR